MGAAKPRLGPVPSPSEPAACRGDAAPRSDALIPSASDAAPRPSDAEACPGGAGTLANAFYTPPGSFDTRMGASYRLVTSLGEYPVFRSITWPGQSGHPGSPHYADQAATRAALQLYPMLYVWAQIHAEAETRQRLEPSS